MSYIVLVNNQQALKELLVYAQIQAQILVQTLILRHPPLSQRTTITFHNDIV